MAIVKEFYKTREDGINLYRTYSDENKLIKKVGTEEIYEEAVDVENATYEYKETTETLNDEATEQDYLSALARLGVE